MLEPVKLLNNARFSSKNVPSNSFLMGQPRPLLSFIFGLFKQTSLQQFLQQNIGEKCPSRIQGFELTTFAYLLPQPLEKGPTLHKQLCYAIVYLWSLQIMIAHPIELEWQWAGALV